MNSGAISTRYAKALLKYVQETGHGEQVCAQARTLLGSDASASIKLEPELEKFVQLVSSHGRMGHIRAILQCFIGMYYKSAGIVSATLTTAVSAPDLEDRIRTMLEKQTGCRVILSVSVDPALIGGFTLELDDKMLDASVRHQIDAIRRQFVIQNNRLV